MQPIPQPGSSIALDEISPRAGNDVIASARELLLEYGRHIVSQPGSAQFCFGALEHEAKHLPAGYIDQGGGCILARVGGQPAGFIAWRSVAPKVEARAWEMKRLWVRPLARGLGLGRTLTEAVLQRARAANQNAIYLDTVPATMAAAYLMYIDMGFLPCSAYNDNSMEGIMFLRLPLNDSLAH